MFDPMMLAPCGLDCTICHRAVESVNPCKGCRGPEEFMADFCRNRCPIRKCEKRADFATDFCDTCPDYPCEEVTEKQTRYTTEYPLTESPDANLRQVRQNGMDTFIAEETARWTCSECGGVICVHSGTCARCGKTYGDQSKNHEK